MLNLSLNDIAERIADVVLEHKITSKESLIVSIRPILKIWLKKADATKKYKGKDTPKAILQNTIEQRAEQSEYWRQQVISLEGKENMEVYYKKLDKLLIEKGFKKDPNA